MNSMDFKIDKSNWTKISFGDVVREVREVSKDPLSEGLERLIGLEHIEPENIHIKNWGLIKDGTTFNRKFSKGQVLFGRRRAYLKKAAVADFDGICSGDITVLEAKDGLMPKLLPFIVQNEKFFDYAIKNSAGSLSPRVKFKDLANYQFLLPPKNQQSKIVELLLAGDEQIEYYNILKEKLNNLYKVIIKEINIGKPNWQKIKLKEIISLQYGKGLKEPERINGEFPVVGSSGICDTHNEYLIEGPGIVVGRKGSVGEVTWISQNFWPIDTAYWVKQESKSNDLKFIYYLLLSSNLKKLSIATAVPGINRDDVLMTRVLLPPLNEQEAYRDRLNSIMNTDNYLNRSRSINKEIIKNIQNQLL